MNRDLVKFIEILSTMFFSVALVTATLWLRADQKDINVNAIVSNLLLSLEIGYVALVILLVIAFLLPSQNRRQPEEFNN